jgi:hypothetical protein
MSWPEPWQSVAANEADQLLRELQREVTEGHPLFAVSVQVLAHRPDTDDVLIALDDSSAAEVHLTWSRREENPPYPWTTSYPNLEDWLTKQETS